MSTAQPLRVVVIGGGALGCLYAASLAATGAETWVVDHGDRTVAALRSHGVTLEEKAGARRVPVQATADPTEVPGAGFAILLVKAPALEDAARSAAAALAPDGWAVALQNGFGHGETVARRIPRDRVLHGVTYAGAVRTGPGRIVPTGWGPTVFGPLEPQPLARLEALRRALDAAQLEPRLTARPLDAIWRKSAVACATNAATALLRCRLGGLDTEPGRRLTAALLDETLAVAAAEGIALDRGELRSELQRIVSERAETVPSMLQDVRAGRATEIDTQNGYVAARAAELGLPAPWNGCVAALVRAQEAAPGARLDLNYETTASRCARG